MDWLSTESILSHDVVLIAACIGGLILTAVISALRRIVFFVLALVGTPLVAFRNSSVDLIAFNTDNSYLVMGAISVGLAVGFVILCGLSDKSSSLLRSLSIFGFMFSLGVFTYLLLAMLGQFSANSMLCRFSLLFTGGLTAAGLIYSLLRFLKAMLPCILWAGVAVAMACILISPLNEIPENYSESLQKFEFSSTFDLWKVKAKASLGNILIKYYTS